MKKFCELGIEEIMVLSGNAEQFEVRHKEACPNLKVIYNEKQKAKILMKKHGKWMVFFKFLYPQVDALDNLIKDEECSTCNNYCVQDI